MRGLSSLFGVVASGAFVLAVAAPACGGSGDTFGGDGGPGGSNDGSFVTDVPLIGTFDGQAPPTDGGPARPSGLSCNVSCPGGGTTTISGKVYDPAGKDPLYNVTVYIPANPLQPLPRGVPTGADACDCNALFKSGAIAATTTAVDGSFKITNAPVGTTQLVLQIGKWRRVVPITIKSCTDNMQADKSLALPGTVAAGDTVNNMPDIAVSTGSADTLECLMKRIGIPDAEYVAGTGTGGHVHVFSGGGGGGQGSPERHIMPGAPDSATSLWASQTQLMPFDILLLSCEGGETNNANPTALQQYLDAGGRAFASHFHYAWFNGSQGTPPGWGSNLAAWTPGSNGDPGAIGGAVDQTLNGSTKPFAKGVALSQWLGIVNALGKGLGVPANEVSIYQSRYNALVSAANTPSQPWITADANSSQTGQTMYFSFDTPVTATAADGGAPNYCGRAVFSGLHVNGDPSNTDTCNSGGGGGQAPPAGCGANDLSPQEKVLEFMLFDLSSCVIPDTVAPPDGGGIIIR